jgi:hypothetical protein
VLKPPDARVVRRRERYPMFTAAKAKDLQDYCEAQIAVGPPTTMAISVTGEEYHVLSMTGAPDRDSAVEAAKRSFDAYLANSRPNSKLYWRVTPEIGEEVSKRRSLWGFYMRLLISDKPAKET